MPASFSINSLPVADLQSPNDANGRLAKMVYTAGSGWASPRMQVVWTYSAPEGGQPQTKYQLEIAISTTPTSSGGSASTTIVSGEVASSAASATPTPSSAYIEGNYYFVRLRVNDGLEWSAWDGWYQCRVRWGLTTHRKDVNIAGSAPTAWSVTTLSTTEPSNTDIVVEYNSTATAVTATDPWKSDLSAVTKRNYVHYRVWFFGWGASPASRPSLTDLIISTSGYSQTPDDWEPNPVSGVGASIEVGTFVFGSQSLRMDGNGSSRLVRQEVRVEAHTVYVLQGKIKSTGNSGARLQLSDTNTGTSLVETTALTADTDTFDLQLMASWDSGNRTSVWVQCRVTGAAGTAGFFDAIKMEKGEVASTHTPSFIGVLPAYGGGTAAVVDGGGVQVDASKGGIFRLRSSAGNVVELGSAGLELDGDPVGIPSGVIVMWSGQTSAIPTGWLLCDGTSGTPDLRDRFIVGADSSNEGTSGGSVSPTVGLTTHADHADHTHELPIRVSGSTVIFFNNPTGTVKTPSGNTTVTAGGGNSAVSLSDAEDPALDHDAHAVYKYYRLAYIMKS